MDSDNCQSDDLPQSDTHPGPEDLCTLTLLLADAGGRGLGGLPLALEPGSSPLPGAFRVGHPLPLKPGDHVISLPLSPPQRVAVSLSPGEERTLDLGRLGSLIPRVRRGMEHLYVGAPCRLTSLQGEVIDARLDDEILLWPGSYSLDVDLPGGRRLSRDIKLEAGRLLEVELGEGPGARRVRDLAGEFTGAARTLFRRAGLGGSAGGRKGDLRGSFGIITAAGRPMGGPVHIGQGTHWLSELDPSTLKEVIGPMSLKGVGGLGLEVEDVMASGGLRLGSLEVHLKDPEGLSLRGAPLMLQDLKGGAAIMGELGRGVDLWPGSYQLSLPTLPGFERIVEVPGGAPTQLDLGLAHQITIDPDRHPLGSSVTIWREGAPEGDPPLARGSVGVECLLPKGRYRVLIGGSEEVVMAAKRRRKVWPSVRAQFLGGDGAHVSPS